MHATGTTETALVAETNARQLFCGESGGAAVRPVRRAGQSSHALGRRGRADGHLAQPRAAAFGVPSDRWLDDAAAAVASVIAAPAGVYNVADTDPPTRAEIDAALAAAVGRRAMRSQRSTSTASGRAIARSQRVSELASARDDPLGATCGVGRTRVAHPRQRIAA